MADIDEFASSLLDEAKRFLEKSKESSDAPAKRAFLHAALIIGFCSLEAHVNSVAEDLAVRSDLTQHERALLLEKDVRLDHGVFVLGGLKIFRLEDRILFMHARFSERQVDRRSAWWSQLGVAVAARNSITHPKGMPALTEKIVEQGLEAIIRAIHELYRAVYKKPFPAVKRGLQSRYSF